MQGMNTYTRLTQVEREQIFLLLHQGESIREIGKRLGRNHTTISRELKHTKGSPYSPVNAHASAVDCRHQADKHKLDDPLLQAYVIGKLGDHWSPEQIAGRLTYVHSRVTVVHKTIYAFLYQPRVKHERLWEFLRRGHKKRERWFDRRTRHYKRALILGKISIRNNLLRHKHDLRLDTGKRISWKEQRKHVMWCL